METYYKAINWNAIEDVIDKSTWEKLTEQFWLDTRIPLSKLSLTTSNSWNLSMLSLTLLSFLP